MYLDVVDLRDFYAAPAGQMVARQLSPVIGGLIKVDAGTRVLGFGFATPYLGAIRGAERVLAFMPAGQGVIDWPAGNGSSTALVEEDSLPLPDSSIDLAILVHALEMSARPNSLMAELRRVLTGNGRLVIVVPNRQGPWARSDISPFGFGRPYTRGQLRGLFAEAGFEAEAWRTALHMPPATSRPMLGAAGPLDSIGRVLWPAFAGVIVVSAARRNVQGLGVRVRPRLAPALKPVFRPNVGVAGRLPP
jgi:SAM-dependent methyltransferase